MKPLEREFQYYQKNKQFFVDNYEGRYIVLVGERLLGSYASQMKAISETQKHYELGTFLVHKVVKNETPIVIPRAQLGTQTLYKSLETFGKNLDKFAKELNKNNQEMERINREMSMLHGMMQAIANERGIS